MEDLTYIIDSLLTLSRWSKPVLVIMAFFFLSILYLVWTLHDKVDKMTRNQAAMVDEIKKLKGERENE